MTPALFEQAGIRPHQIASDVMEPTLRSGDFLMVIPVRRYDYDGIYLVDGQVYRAEARIGSGKVMLWRDNPRYDRWEISRAEFDQTVEAKAVAEVRMKVGLHEIAGMIQ